MIRGRPYDDDIDVNVIGILKDNKFGTPEQIKKHYKKIFEINISWITIKKHLERLYENDVLEKKIISEGKKRKIIIYNIK